MIVPICNLKLEINIRCGFINKSFSLVSFFMYSPITLQQTSIFLKVGGKLEIVGFNSSGTIKLHCT